ncbi:hypothetical protein Ddye_007963 [Dipteronia dyeriana]|uniref:Uncharacterized protein n=1 Tax=Dipteronia dyeriana TaxID=168575 RepID=A0AAE0CKX4_9ROSI|nr:hypothetical protein Ddye_007963 [Dipteronia dyeriana]
MTLVLTGQHVVLEESHPTVDEKLQPYLVGVDMDLSQGPQFVPLNYDDSEQRLSDEIDDDDANDGVHQHFESRRAENLTKVQGEYVDSPNVQGNGSHGEGDITSGKGVGERDA